jgi:hypothetical protein
VGADTATPSFTAPIGPAVLSFRLTVDDGELSDTDEVTVTVNAPDPVNQAPVADAGADQTVNSSSVVLLDGSGSFDPDGDELSFDWEQLTGPTVVLVGADTATPSFTAPIGPAVLSFRLTVDDGELSDTDEVTVTVNAPASLDLATVPYLKGEVKAHKPFTKFQVWVENLFGERTLVDISEVNVSITVNGDPVDPGEIVIAKPIARNIREGKIGKFGFIWNHGQNTLRAGDEIVITACVDVDGDDNEANNCGSISRPDGIIDLAPDASKAKDIRVGKTSSKFKVSLFNVGEVAAVLDLDDLEVSATINGDDAAVQPQKVGPLDKITLLPKAKMVKPPVFKFDIWRYKSLNVALQWDHGQLEIGDEIEITACSTVPGDVDSDVPAPPLFEPTDNNNCTTVTRFVIP